MPTYEYACITNGHRFEVKQSFSDDALTECVECGEPVRKVFNAAGLVFKGSGYYVNDSRKASGSGTSSTSSPSSSDSAGASSSTSSTPDSSSKSSSSDSSSKSTKPATKTSTKPSSSSSD